MSETAPSVRPSDRPTRRTWVVLAAILGFAAVVDLLTIGHSGSVKGFYLGAVNTMAHSWRLFLVGGLDRGGWFTLDKLPGAFWIQATSVRLFGFTTWAVVGPQIIEGLLTIAVVYRCVTRYASTTAGLIAATVVATAPVSTAVSRGNGPDALSTLALVLAADAAIRATTAGRMRSLLASGAWIGVAFQAKMIQAWLVIPVVALAYLLAGPPALATRLRHLAAFVAVAIATSLSYLVIALSIGASHRPWFDGSRHNSILEQVFVYNAFGRLGSGSNPSVTGTGTVAAGRAATVGAPAIDWTRMLAGPLALGAAWLVPAAIVLGVVLIRRGRQRGPSTPASAAAALWLGWLIIHLAVFTVLRHANVYYPVVLVPAIGALIGPGLVAIATPEARLGRPWLLPVLVAGTGGYAVVLLADAHPGWSALRWTVLAITVVAAAAVARPATTGPARVLAFGLVGVTALLAPVIGSVVLATHDGGPYSAAFSDGGLVPQHWPTDKALVARYRTASDGVAAYLESHDTGQAYLVATSGSDEAASLITATNGRRVLPIGGYTGLMPVPSLAQLQRLVADGSLRYVLAPFRSTDPRLRWVERSCRENRRVSVHTESTRELEHLYECR